MSSNSKIFNIHPQTKDFETRAANEARNPFIQHGQGGTAEYSSWGLYHSYAWKLRLELITLLQPIFRNDIYSSEYLRDVSSLLLQLNFLFVGVFKKEETDEIEKRLNIIELQISEFLRTKRVVKNKLIPNELLKDIKECYKLLSLYQQIHGLLLPINKITTNAIDQFENAIVEN